MLVYLRDPYHLGWHAEPTALFIGPMTLRWTRKPPGRGTPTWRTAPIYIIPFYGYSHPLAQTVICPNTWRR